jgi:hypothetical protein
MPGLMMGSPISPSIQSMITEQVALTKSALTGGGTKSWLIMGAVILVIIFLVKKVT